MADSSQLVKVKPGQAIRVGKSRFKVTNVARGSGSRYEVALQGKKGGRHALFFDKGGMGVTMTTFSGRKSRDRSLDFEDVVLEDAHPGLKEFLAERRLGPPPKVVASEIAGDHADRVGKVLSDWQKGLDVMIKKRSSFSRIPKKQQSKALKKAKEASDKLKEAERALQDAADAFKEKE